MIMARLGGIPSTFDLVSKGDALQFSTGQIIRARVLEACGEEIILLLAGRRLQVRSEVPLDRGQELQLLVVGKGQEQEGALVLRVIDGLFTSPHRPDTTQVCRLLGEVGVETAPGNIRLASELIRQGFSVTADTLDMLCRALDHPEPSPGEAMALVWLWGRGLPLTEAFLNPLVTLFQEETPDLLQNLFPFLAARQGEGQARWRQLLQQLLYTPSRDGGRPLQDLPHLLGIDYETLLGCTLFSRGTDYTESAGGAGADLQHQIEKKTLKPFLLALGQGDRTEFPAELQELLAKITGLQLLHAGPWSLHGMGWLDLPGQAPPFFLSVQEEERGRGGGQKRCLAVVLFLTLPSLGPVLVELRCDSVLTLTLTVEKAAACRVLDGYRQELQAAMEDLPWRVQVLPCRLQENPTVRETWLRRLISLPHTQQRVDIRL